MKKFLVVLSSVALLGLLAVPGFTQGRGHWGGGHGGMGGPGMMFPFMIKKLGLTEAQQKQVDDLMATHRSNFKNFFSQMKDAQDALTTKLLTPPTSPDSPPLTVGDLDTKTISDIRGQLMNEGLQFAVDIHNILTPEQLKTAATLHAQMKALRDQEHALMGGNQQQ